jgi:hypothetical protein
MKILTVNDNNDNCITIDDIEKEQNCTITHIILVAEFEKLNKKKKETNFNPNHQIKSIAFLENEPTEEDIDSMFLYLKEKNIEVNDNIFFTCVTRKQFENRGPNTKHKLNIPTYH